MSDTLLFGDLPETRGRVELDSSDPDYERLAASLRPSQQSLAAIRKEEAEMARAQLRLPFMLVD